jgi:hypothetical protein
VHVQAEARQRRFLRRVTAHVLRVARARPLLLIQEDSQWSDESSTALLKYVLRNVALARSLGHPAKVGFVLTQRPATADNAVARWRSIVSAQADYEGAPIELELGGMTLAESTELVASLLACAPGAELTAFVEALLGSDEARPMWVEHALRTFLIAGHLTRGMFEPRGDGTQRWTGRWLLDVELARSAPRPKGIDEAIARNAQQLSVGTMHVLAFAAALGRQFAVEVIARAADEEPVAVLDFLDEAVAAGFVRDVESLELAEAASRTRGRELVFCHDRYREALYDALGEDERRTRHRRLAAALIAVRGDVPEVAEDLTRQHAGAGDYAAAFASAVRAAEHATAQSGYDRAADLYAAALDFAGHASLAVSATVRDAFARVAVYCGRFDDAARELTLLARDPELGAETRWDVSLRLAELLYRKQQYRDAIAPLEDVLRDMGETVPRGRMARTLISIPHVLNIVARGMIKGAINMAPADEPALAEVRSRAWYMLAESYNFIDNKDVLFAGAVNGGQVVSRGLHGFSAPVLAGMAYLFGSEGMHAVSRRYHDAASVLLDGDPAAVGAPDVTARALSHMLLLGARQLRGELGVDAREAISQSVAAALAATQESGDPQRTWLVLAFVSMLHWHAGHLQSYQECMRWLLRGVRASRLEILRTFLSNYADARGHEIEGDFVAAEAAWSRYCALHAEVGGERDGCLGRANMVWMHALRDDPARADELSLIETTAREAAATCLARRFQYFEGPILPRLLGAILLTTARPGDARPLIRACRKSCLRSAAQRPGYLAVLAALDAMTGQLARARRRFDAATDMALASGLVDVVLDAYRLAARTHPAGSDGRAMYAWLEHTLAARIAAAPGLSVRQLAEGGFAPPIEVPLPRDWNRPGVIERS